MAKPASKPKVTYVVADTVSKLNKAPTDENGYRHVTIEGTSERGRYYVATKGKRAKVVGVQWFAVPGQMHSSLKTTGIVNGEKLALFLGDAMKMTEAAKVAAAINKATGVNVREEPTKGEVIKVPSGIIKL
jgi:hypothetical protein